MADQKTKKPPETEAVPKKKANPHPGMDPNAPNARKAQQKSAAEEKHPYEVLKTQMIDGQWYSPSEDKSKPTIVKMTEIQARFRVLNSKLKRAK